MPARAAIGVAERRSATRNVREQLDYSRRSLEVLESWLLEQYSAPQALMRNSNMLDGAARYVDETFRRTLGAHWIIDLEKRNDAYFGLPVLTSTHSPVSPFSLTMAATHRRMGTYLIGAKAGGVRDRVLHRARRSPQRLGYCAESINGRNWPARAPSAVATASEPYDSAHYST